MNLRRIGVYDFIDMYDELRFNPEDDCDRKYAAFLLANLNPSILEQKRNHLVWVMNYLDCLQTELETDSKFCAFLQVIEPNIDGVRRTFEALKGQLQFSGYIAEVARRNITQH